MTGTADPNATIEIRDADGNVIATGTADGTGSFAVNLPAGTANANETLTALAKDPRWQYKYTDNLPNTKEMK